MSIDNVQDIAPRVQYVAATSQVAFDYPFPIFADADLVVDVDGVTKALNTDYTVSGEGEDTGGTVTFTVAPGNGAVVTIYRDIEMERSTDFQQNGPLASVTINDELDKIILLLQEQRARIDRCVRFPLNGEALSAEIEMTPIDNWKSKFLFVDADGNLEPATAIDADTLSQSTIGAALYPRTTAEQAIGVTPSNFAHPGDGDVAYRVKRVGMLPSASAVENATALQNAINVMDQAGGGVVFIPEGSYSFAGNIDLKDGVAIVGAGPFATILTCTTAGATGFQASSALNGVMLANFRLLGTNVANANENGIEIVGHSSNGFPKLVLRNLLVSQWGNVGIYLENCWDALVEACNASLNKSHGFHFVRSFSLGGHKNVAFQNEGHGFFIQRAAGSFFSGTAQENDLNGWRVETAEGCEFVTYLEQNGHSGSASTTAQFYLGQASGGFNQSSGNKIHVFALGGAGSTSPTLESAYGVYIDAASDNEVTGTLGGHLTNDVLFTSNSARNTLGRRKFLTGLTSDTPTPFANNATDGTNLIPVGLYFANIPDSGTGNVGTGEDDLFTYSLPAGTLWFNRQGIQIQAWGTTAANGNNKRLRVYFGSTVVADSGAVAANNDEWSVTVNVFRRGATTQYSVIVASKFNGAPISGATTFTAPAETLANAITIKCTGEATSDSDIVQRGLIVRGL